MKLKDIGCTTAVSLSAEVWEIIVDLQPSDIKDLVRATNLTRGKPGRGEVDKLLEDKNNHLDRLDGGER